MAVYKRGYERYRGRLEGRWRRLLVLPRYTFRRMFRQRHAIVVLVASLAYPLWCAVYIYLAGNADLLDRLGSFRQYLAIDGAFFLRFVSVQKVFAVFIVALTGPGLVSPDLTDNALPLYFSRPLSRADYVVGRLAAPVALLSLATWVPGVLLFLLQCGSAGGGWFAANWRVGVGMVAGFWLWLALCGMVALAGSAYVKLRPVASGLVLGFFFVLGGVAGMVNLVFRGTAGSLLNPSWAVWRLSAAVMGTDGKGGAAIASAPGAAAAAVALAVLLLLLVLVLERKLRPVEVVS
ncbi:MAG: hypothetical protein LBT74_07800 [Acidobacteriota bacterium]|jgi:ABC-type transport system involved in multi-copper enzyme maturation permease subunit|nr:hypothetical protein [Acidobacteriota bacterium]